MTAQQYQHPTSGEVVEAIRFTDDTLEAIANWLPAAKYMFVGSPGRLSLHVAVTEGTSVAHPGDWVIRDQHGELYIQPAEVFRYEPIAISEKEETDS